MSSMVKHCSFQHLTIALLISAALASPLAAQSVSVPVVQPLPQGYQGGSASMASAPAVQPLSQPIQMVGEGGEWDQARSRLRLSSATQMVQAVDRWKLLSRSDHSSFAEYSGFILSNPGFPGEEKLRRNAERALERESAEPSRLIAFFDRAPPLTNSARAHYALALAAIGGADAQGQALVQALAAWRGGMMSDSAEAAISAMLAGRLTAADQDARMDALLWSGATAPAERQFAKTSPQARDLFAARLAAIKGINPDDAEMVTPAGASGDPGWLYNRARQLKRARQHVSAASLLANRAPLSSLPFDAEKWVDLQLAAARGADTATVVRIASKIDDGFAPGADVSRLSFALRDDYTSLMWLGGTRALWQQVDARRAAPLFWRYGAAARTPQTRSKGFYWAGRALAQAGDSAGAQRYFAMAAAYPGQFYGQLALERQGQPLPPFANGGAAMPTPTERATFAAQPITAAVREVARESDWPTAVRFFREISDQAKSRADHQLVADLARELGRRDLGVILGMAAESDGFGDLPAISFPLIPVPQGSDWTMIHAITRQESQFAMNAVSHAGARGLMQLMPGTARGEAGKIGLSYDAGALINDAGYNLRLGNSYIQRMLSYYHGSYPLAVAAYNAGPGNVNKWLRINGDPRQGEMEWIDWIESIPFSETRNYVQRVLENAVVYEALNPDKASYRGPNPLSRFLGKRTPG